LRRQYHRSSNAVTFARQFHGILLDIDMQEAYHFTQASHFIIVMRIEKRPSPCHAPGDWHLRRSLSVQKKGKTTMSDAVNSQSVDVAPDREEIVDRSSAASPVGPAPLPSGLIAPSEVRPSDCGCKGAAAGPQLVFALGQLGHDYSSEARLDSIVQKIAGAHNQRNPNAKISPHRGLAYDRDRILAHLEDEDHAGDAASFEWTLSLNGTPIYAIRPTGAFAAETYEDLREALATQHRLQLAGEEVGRVSIPGVIAGSARLLNGQVVPTIIPESRGMFQWTTAQLIESLLGVEPNLPDSPTEQQRTEYEAYQRQKATMLKFLDRVYHELRNLGVSPQERALNYAGTNVQEMLEICKDVRASQERGGGEELDLDSIQVTRSSICRPGSECWDILVYFFFPQRPVQHVRKVYRYTVDVSDVIPVTVRRMRNWFTR
jgi:cyanobactin maturation PatA/PatG family protease